MHIFCCNDAGAVRGHDHLDPRSRDVPSESIGPKPGVAPDALKSDEFSQADDVADRRIRRPGATKRRTRQSPAREQRACNVDCARKQANVPQPGIAMGVRLILPNPILVCVRWWTLRWEIEMRSFICACVAAIAIAAIGAAVLNVYQEPVKQAFATESVRI